MAEKGKSRKIAVIRVRGNVDVRKPIKDTFGMLSLRRVNWAVVIDDTPTYMGMLHKIKDFVTWGEIDSQTLTALLEKWGRGPAERRLTQAEVKDFVDKFMSGETTFKKAEIRPYFALHPPSKGRERGGIKTHVKIGGVLGNRGDGIKELLSKMGGLGLVQKKVASEKKSEEKAVKAAPKKAESKSKDKKSE